MNLQSAKIIKILIKMLRYTYLFMQCAQCKQKLTSFNDF